MEMFAGNCLLSLASCFTPRVCAVRDKVTTVGCIIVGVSTKITIILSQDLGIQVTCKHNESIESDKKLASVCLKSRDTVHERHKCSHFVGHRSHAY